jgi:hypothetical protein
VPASGQSVTYRLPQRFNGAGFTDTFTYIVRDSAGGSARASVNVVIASGEKVSLVHYHALSVARLQALARPGQLLTSGRCTIMCFLSGPSNANAAPLMAGVCCTGDRRTGVWHFAAVPARFRCSSAGNALITYCQQHTKESCQVQQSLA